MIPKLENDILIVDDEARLANNMQTLLGWEGYQTRRAANGQEAIELIEAQPPSLIITDIMMPKVDGYQLLKYVKEKVSHIPIIVVTGFGSIDSAIKAMQMGASDYILKPFDHGLLIETVARAAEESRRNWYAALRKEIITAVSGTLSLKVVMEKIIELSKQGTGAENGSLFILDEEGQVTRRTLLAQTESDESAKKIIDMVMEKGLSGWIYRQQQSALINNVKADERWLDLPDRNYSVESVIGVPCISRQKVQGIIVLIHSKAKQFDQIDLKFLQSIASPVAMSIENARLFEREHQLREDMVALYKAGLEIASPLDEKTTAKTILHQVASLLKADYCAIAYRQQDSETLSNHLNLIFQAGTWSECTDSEEQCLSDDYPTLPRVLAEKKTISRNINSPDLSAAEKHWLQSKGIHSLMLYPLPWHNHVIGLITLARSQEASPFTSRDKRLMVDLSPQVATAIENARLFEVVAAQTVWAEAQAHELEDERRKLAAILSSASDVILAIDKQGNILLANPALNRNFEIDHQAILDQPYQDALQNTSLLDMFNRVRAENNAFSLEIESPGGKTWYANVTPVPDMGYMAVLRDISHLKELDKMRIELLSTASHDLKTPLTIIQGYINLLKELGDLNDKQHSAVDSINHAVVSMVNLIGELLDLAHLESGLSLQLAPYPFNYLVQNTLSALMDMAAGKEIALVLELDDDLDEVTCDPRRIRQALTNLIGNAIKYAPAGGKVTVKTAVPKTHPAFPEISETPEKAQVLVSVQDEGYGIEAEALPHIFDRFYRVQTEQTEGIEGTGLGLAIVKSIIEQHRGKIWVESQVGKGSTFRFII